MILLCSAPVLQDRHNCREGHDRCPELGLADGMLARLEVVQRDAGWLAGDDQPGSLHTFNLWMCENGFRADQVLLTQNAGYAPP